MAIVGLGMGGAGRGARVAKVAIATLAIAAAVWSCRPRVAELEIRPGTVEARTGETLQLEAVARAADGDTLEGREVEWRSTDSSRAVVLPNGLLVALAPGDVVVQARAGDVVVSAAARIRPAPVREVSAGQMTTCVLVSPGEAVCWGVAVGRAGAVSVSASGSPAPQKLATVRTGPGAHACGLDWQGRAYCWGANLFGNLGDGTIQSSRSAVAVSTDRRFHSITVGAFHTCALDRGGEAFCWGLNDSGQLGDGGEERCAPQSRCAAEPRPVRGGRRFEALTAGSLHTCGLDADGVAYCWGEGHGNRPARIGGAVRFTTIDAGHSHTCGITAEGEAYCWGSNRWGQLGDGTRFFRRGPTRVRTDERFRRISAGGHWSFSSEGGFTCAITLEGAPYCWGDNTYGQLGTGDRGASRLRPVRVGGEFRFLRISAGVDHACGVTLEGEAYCWGNNDRGQLGRVGETGLVPVALRVDPDELAGDRSSRGVAPHAPDGPDEERGHDGPDQP